MNRLWRRLDVTVTLIAQGSGRLHAHGVNANRYGGITNPGSYLTACD
jgi:hypothetical protein